MKNSQQVKSLVNRRELGVHSCGENLLIKIGKKRATWYARVQNGKKREDVIIGSYNAFTLSEARLKVTEIHDDLLKQESGKTPQKKYTLHDVYYLLEPKLPVSTRKRTTGLFNNYIDPKLGSRDIGDISPTDVYGLIEAIDKAGFKTPATNSVKLLKRIYKLAIKLELTTRNPVYSFDSEDTGSPDLKRKRTLSMDELKVFFHTLRKRQRHNRKMYLAFAIKTALTIRTRELRAIKIEHINFDQGFWLTPDELRTKTKFIHHIIPLEPEVISWMEEIISWGKSDTYLFPNVRDNERPMDDCALSNLVGEMFKQNEFPNHFKSFVPHDLRRTGRTYMSKKGILYEVAEACLGHKKKGVDDIYNLDDHFDDRRAAQRLYLDKIAPFIDT